MRGDMGKMVKFSFIVMNHKRKAPAIKNKKKTRIVKVRILIKSKRYFNVFLFNTFCSRNG